MADRVAKGGDGTEIGVYGGREEIFGDIRRIFLNFGLGGKKFFKGLEILLKNVYVLYGERKAFLGLIW